jgi:hypothetical protein
MKINIGPYRGDLIPIRRLEKRYEYWRRPETYYLPEEEYTKYDKIVFGFFDWLENIVRPINRWSNNRKRKIKIHVDYYDVWGADHTLGMIIAPTLKKLKEHQHGYPHVDDEDVPEELRMNDADREKLENNGEVDSKHEARWNYILDEMIWAFEQHADPYDGETQFFHNPEQLEMVFTPVEGMPASSLSFNHQKDPTKPPYWRDDEGLKKHHERKRNGVRLFAKYYECLWD